MDQAGAIVGPLIALAVLPSIGIRGVFWLSAIPGLVALAVLALYVAEIRAKRTGRLNFRPLLSSSFLRVVAVNGIFALGAFNFSFVLLRSISLGVQEELMPLVYAIINMAHTLIAVPAGALADRVGRENALFVVIALFTLTCLVAVIGNSWIYAFVLAALFGLYFGSAETVQKALVAAYVPQHALASAYGLFGMVIGFGTFAANMIVGSLWDSLGPGPAFLYSLILSLLAMASLITMGIIPRERLR